MNQSISPHLWSPKNKSSKTTANGSPKKRPKIKTSLKNQPKIKLKDLNFDFQKVLHEIQEIYNLTNTDWFDGSDR